MACTSSIAPVDVVPTHAWTKTGRQPSSMSSASSRSRWATSMAWVTGSTSTMRTFPAPIPAIMAAFTSDEWACEEP